MIDDFVILLKGEFSIGDDDAMFRLGFVNRDDSFGTAPNRTRYYRVLKPFVYNSIPHFTGQWIKLDDN